MAADKHQQESGIKVYAMIFTIIERKVSHTFSNDIVLVFFHCKVSHNQSYHLFFKKN